MKKTLSNLSIVLGCLVSILCIFPIQVTAQVSGDPTDDTIEYWSQYGDTEGWIFQDWLWYKITDDNECSFRSWWYDSGFLEAGGYHGDIIVPETVSDPEGTIYTVTSIEGIPFTTGLTSLSSPKTLRKFYALCCSDIKNLNLNNGLEICGGIVDCLWLEELIIPNSVVEFIAASFSSSELLRTINADCKVRDIPKWCFCQLPSLEQIKFGDCIETIGPGCFCDLTVLPEITLPAALQSISEDSFNGCPALSHINCMAPLPPEVGANCFEQTDRQNCILTVPEESIGLYRQDEFWGQFANIQTNGVARTWSESVSVSAADGCIKIDSPAGCRVAVCTLDGSKVVDNTLSPGEHLIDVAPGVYLVRISNRAIKLVVK